MEDEIQEAMEEKITMHFDTLAASWEVEYIGVVDRSEKDIDVEIV
jgi:hypothetical protein